MALAARVNQRLLQNIETRLPVAPAQGPWPTEALLLTQIPMAEAAAIGREAQDHILQGEAPGHQLLMLEHPHTFALDADTDRAALALSDEQCAQMGAEVYVSPNAAGRRAGVEYFGPGELMLYVTFALEHAQHPEHASPDGFVAGVEDMVLAVLAELGITGERQDDGRSVRVGGRVVASLATRVSKGIAQARVGLHTNTDLDWFEETGADAAHVTTLTALGMAVEEQDRVRELVLKHYEKVFGSRPHIPQSDDLHRMAKPPWLKAKVPYGKGTEFVHEVMAQQRLHTVCESAHCPNMGECWRHGTATFMINGNVCTRSCSFCAIFTGRPQPLDPDEPRRVAEAARKMDLKFVVVTSVNRDEREDGGAYQFVATIEELRRAVPDVRVEVLIPDFKGNQTALEAVFAARPDVLNHNIETVPELYRRVRPQADYKRSLRVIRLAKMAGLTTKSGIMLGLGETDEQVERVLHDLWEHGCDIVTIGQYLRPSPKHHPVVRYVTPGEFDHWREVGKQIGLGNVQSGPLVRSSYHAHESFAHLK